MTFHETDDDETGIEEIAIACAAQNERITTAVGLDVRRLCPIGETGELLDSIHDTHPEPLVGRVNVGTQYWDMLEYGSWYGAHTEGPYPPTVRKTDEHSYMDAEPFLRPSLYIERAL